MAAVRPTVVRLNPDNPSRRPPRRANHPPDPTRNIHPREINPYCALPSRLRFERSEPVAYRNVPARGAYEQARKVSLPKSRKAAVARRASVPVRAVGIEQEVALDEAPLTLLREGGEDDASYMRARFEKMIRAALKLLH